jgi:hypothetical protein
MLFSDASFLNFQRNLDSSTTNVIYKNRALRFDADQRAASIGLKLIKISRDLGELSVPNVTPLHTLQITRPASLPLILDRNTNNLGFD